jgi:hypothetical protein
VISELISDLSCVVVSDLSCVVVSDLTSVVISVLNSERCYVVISDLSSERCCLPIFGVLANPNRVKILIRHRTPTRAFE